MISVIVLSKSQKMYKAIYQGCICKCLVMPYD